MSVATADKYATILSRRVSAERLALAGEWLDRLKQLLPVDPNEVFPSDQILDHVPTLIAEIAAYLRAPADEEIAANTAVINKARELGVLRHEQRASVHQLLREYELLAQLLHTFIAEETGRLSLTPSSTDVFDVLARLAHAIATLMRTTVDTFIGQYTATIQDQHDRLMAFNRAASHELRSPIGTILFAAGLLEKARHEVVHDEARLMRIATTIQANAERLRWLIENLQRIARFNEPVDVPSEQRIEVETIATEVARQLAEMASARQVSICVMPGLPTIVIDPARLELALLNLVSNAIKYSNPRQAAPSVEIAPAESERGPDWCTIIVRDNGLGIPPGDHDAIFDRFVRVHTDLDQNLGITGSGLGLAIVADCVNAVGGSIRYESSAGLGTTFFITLPAKSQERP